MSISMTPMFFALAGTCLLQFVLWLVMLRQRNAGIVDAGWATSLGLIGIFYAIAYEGDVSRRVALGLITGLWGARLGWHLWSDRVFGKEEEGRYVRLREIWGRRADAHFLWFFLAQALLAVILAVPFAGAASASPAFPKVTDLVALALFALGWAGESLADRQLAVFKRRPESKGRTCREGLWSWSRHPNYFFEWLIWCGFATLGSSTPAGTIGWFSPALLLFLILRVTGIPPTEAQALRTRADYRQYQRTTSAFFPWPPRRRDS